MVFLLFNHHHTLQRYTARVVQDTYNLADALPFAVVAALVAVLAGFVLFVPLVWEKHKTGLSFNHRVFWLPAAPALLVLAAHFLHYSGSLMDWAFTWLHGPAAAKLFWFLTSAHVYTAVAGTLLGAAFALALVIPGRKPSL